MKRDANAESLKFLNDFADAQTYVPKRIKDWPSGAWPRLPKRYIEAGIRLHLNIEFRAGANGKSGDSCLSFEQAVERIEFDESASVLWRPKLNETLVGISVHEMQRLVSVEVRQFVEKPERVVMRRAVKSLERLLPLDYCLLGGLDAPDALLDGLREVPVAPELVRIVENRELDIAIDGLIVETRQLTSQMIKRRAELVQKFTDQDAASWWRIISNERFDEKAAGLGVEIVDNSIRVTVQEGVDLAAQPFEVFYSPIQLRGDASVGLRHNTCSAYGRQETMSEAGRADYGPQAQRLPSQPQESLHAKPSTPRRPNE